MDVSPAPVPADLARSYVADGYWSDESLGEYVMEGLTDGAAKRVRVLSKTRPWDGTMGDVLDLSRRIASGLRRAGIGEGDVVSFQLPNWLEAAAAFYGAALLGAVVVPIVHFYGPKEVAFILRQARTRFLITTDRFGHQDYLANLEVMRPSLPDLEAVAVVGQPSFDDLIAGEPLDAPAAVDPSAPALVAYTSGTTSDPKGVVHSHRTIVGEVRQLSFMQATRPPLIVGAPVGHGIGILSGLLVPVQRRQPIHLIDVWDPATVLRAVLEDGMGAGSGSTYFLTSLLDHPDCTPAHLELMREVGLGGSPIPSAVAERARSLGLALLRSYGSTEHPSTVGTFPHEPEEKRLYTDGSVLPGVEVRIVDDDGNDLPQGEQGEIWSRGPDRCLGYTDAALTASAFDADGWYRTGDIAVMDPDGYLTITDRKKDIIIRGGENISAAEVEELLAHMPGVAEVAVVAAPDERLGEHGCAYFRMQPGVDAPDLPAVRAHLEQAGLTRQKWPEELRSVEDFPRTPSGKVKKFVLRQELRGESAAS
jgi:acyl-CoA synthetase